MWRIFYPLLSRWFNNWLATQPAWVNRIVDTIAMIFCTLAALLIAYAFWVKRSSQRSTRA
jgi:hypothetical protein